MATPEEIQMLRDQTYGKPRRDGAAPVHGYSRKFQGSGGRGSNLDAFYARQRGAAPEGDPRFKGTSGSDIANDMNTRGERTGFGGNGIEPDRNMSPRERVMMGYDVPVVKEGGYVSPTPAKGPSGAGFDVPVNSEGKLGQTPVEGDPFGTGFKPVGANNPFLPPTQPLPAATAAVNPDADSPARFREMAGDARVGRTVNTAGATGLTPSVDGTGPTQAADFRRTISSAYGTGTNVTRMPGQGPATATDIMGRPAPMRDVLQDRKEVQATKNLASKTDDDEEGGNSPGPAPLNSASFRKGRA